MSTAALSAKVSSSGSTPITARGTGQISTTSSPDTPQSSKDLRVRPSHPLRVVLSGFRDRPSEPQWKGTLQYKSLLSRYITELQGQVVQDMDKRVTHIVVAGGKKTTKSLGAILMVFISL